MYEKLIHIAIPSMDEFELLPNTIECIKKQKAEHYNIFVCINQPDVWWKDANKQSICFNNQNTLDYLNEQKAKMPNLFIIDKSSKGKGWRLKHSGVGHARKVLMDAIVEKANDNDIIVSMDADVEVSSNYLASVEKIFGRNPKAVALANPYYHRLSGIEDIDRNMLRYEIYMRSYTINMLRINSPYSFTAFGSVISLPVWAYRKIRGITPKSSGEDFYLLQKLRKMGTVLLHNDEIVYPATRISHRVPFGTGPAISKSMDDLQASYPIFHHSFFDEISETYKLFEELFHKDTQTPMTDFFSHIFKSDDIYTPLRNNFKSREKFIHACHNKVDGLRVFQYLKWRSASNKISENKSLDDLLELLYKNGLIQKEDIKPVCFLSSGINEINTCRDLLFRVESVLRKEHYNDQSKQI